jgi:hypothetical protein
MATNEAISRTITSHWCAQGPTSQMQRKESAVHAETGRFVINGATLVVRIVSAFRQLLAALSREERGALRVSIDSESLSKPYLC